MKKMLVIALFLIIFTTFSVNNSLGVSINISLQKDSYLRGEKVIVKGSILGAESYPVSFIWEAKDSEGRRIDLGQGQTGNEGSYTFSFIIKTASSLGKASIIISCLGTTQTKNFYIKEKSSISISIYPSTIVIGDKITISGKLTPSLKNEQIDVMLYSQGSWKNIGNAYTNTEGKYVYTLKPSSTGDYKVYVKWKGNSKYFEASSKTINFKVTSPKASLTIYSNVTTLKIGEKVRISGSISLVKNTKIYLYIRDPNQRLSKYSVDVENGKYSYVFEPNIIGTWSIKTVWLGNNNYSPTESETIKINVIKMKSNLIVNISPTNISALEKVKILGKIIPSLSNQNIEIIIYSPNNNKLQKNVRTTNNGSFTYSFTVNETGLWKIFIVWKGNEAYQGYSSTTTFYIGKIKSSINIIQKRKIYTLEEKIRINGTLYPNIDNQILKIIVKKQSGSIIYTNTTKTNDQGNFMFIWKPEKTGVYIIRIEWNGTQLYEGSSVNLTIDVFKEKKQFKIGHKGNMSLILYSNSSIISYKFINSTLTLNAEILVGSSTHIRIYLSKEIYETFRDNDEITLYVSDGRLVSSNKYNISNHLVFDYIIESSADKLRIGIALIKRNLTIKIFDFEGNPVSNAMIFLRWENSTIANFTGYTDINGTAYFRNIPAGKYLVNVFYWGRNVKNSTVTVINNTKLSIPTNIGFYESAYKKLVAEYKELKTKYKDLENKVADLEIEREKLLSNQKMLYTIITLLSLVLVTLFVFMVFEHYKNA
ncbi:MAG: hypothetical protein J7K23_00640 [Thermoproteales archaeon]|nr:hypothetical protein [Thermoproteales archaeon]